MYWYYKYPLMVLTAVLVLGLCTLVWRLLPSKNNKQVNKETVSVSPAENPAPPRNPVSASVTAPAVPAITSIPQLPSPAPSATISLPTSSAPAAPSSPAGKSAETVILQRGIKEAEAALKNDNPKLARELAYKELLDATCVEYDARWMAAARIINEANRIFMNGKAPCPEKKSHTIAPNDALIKIAYKNDTTVGALQRLNGLKSSSAIIHPGKSLQYIGGTWKIKVSKSHFLLSLYLNDQLYRIYPVTIGRQDRTPAGTFLVNDKIINPAWTPPGLNIPFGDPRNILGTRWVALKPVENTDQTLSGYGIHGTTDPASIGTAASLGCVRMLNEDVEELYDFIPSSFGKIPVYVYILE